MRLWAKLLLLIVLTGGAQVWIERHAEQIDDAWFVVRIVCAGAAFDESPSDELVREAGWLMERRVERYDAAPRHRAAAAGGGLGK